MSDTRPMRTAGDDEEEDGETPKPYTHPIRHHDRDYASHLSDAHEVLWYAAWQILCHGNNTRDGKARRTNRDEHARTKRFLWQLLSHQAIQESSIDHERHHEAYAL